MVMGNLQNPKPKFHCDNTTISVREDLTLFGVIIDNELKFDTQIANATRKGSQQLAVLKCLRNILPLDIRKDIYHSFIAPHFDYCSDVWHFCSKTTSDKPHINKSYSITYLLSTLAPVDSNIHSKTPSVSIRETDSIIH